MAGVVVDTSTRLCIGRRSVSIGMLGDAALASCASLSNVACEMLGEIARLKPRREVDDLREASNIIESAVKCCLGRVRITPALRLAILRASLRDFQILAARGSLIAVEGRNDAAQMPGRNGTSLLAGTTAGPLHAGAEHHYQTFCWTISKPT